mmetsp:Transcript_105410/g.204117  ORF Transcript_105410/g.204117 Transcript_105410/m.204117 type:complete len:481 (+) Transcript_105410:66-1508(+)
MAQNTPQFGRTTRGIADDAGPEGCLAQADAGGVAVRVLHDTFSRMPVLDDAAVHEAVCLAATPLREQRLARNVATQQLDRANGAVLTPWAEGARTRCVAEHPAKNNDAAGTRHSSPDKKQRSRKHQDAPNEVGMVNQLQQEVWSKDREILQLRALYQEQAQQFHSFRTESSAEVEALKRRMAEFEQLLHPPSGSSPTAATAGFCWSPVIATRSDSPTEEGSASGSGSAVFARACELRPPALLSENFTNTPPEGQSCGVPSPPPTPPSAVANGGVATLPPGISGIATNGGRLIGTAATETSSSESGQRRIQSLDPPLFRLRRASHQQQQQQQCIAGAEQPPGTLQSPRSSQQVAWGAVLSPRNSLQRSFCSSGAPSPRTPSARPALPPAQTRSSSPEASTCTMLQGQRSRSGCLAAAAGPPTRRAWLGQPGAAAARPPPNQSCGMRQAPLTAGWGRAGRPSISGGRSVGNLSCANTASVVG